MSKDWSNKISYITDWRFQTCHFPLVIQLAFCDSCGSPIYTIIPSMPGVQVVKLGLFEEIPKSSMAWYCKSMPCWEKPIDGVKQFDTMTTK